MEQMIAVFSEGKKYAFYEKEAKRIARGALRKLRARNARLEIYLLEGGTMRKLNFRFRRKNKATNVLSFPALRDFPVPETKLRVLGEVYLCPDYIEKKGESFGVMLVHGMLHLFGYDHLKNRDRIRMEKLEKSLCRALHIDASGNIRH